jgi:hypothetical protein
VTVYLPPENQSTGTETEDVPGKDNSADRRQKLAEAAAGAAAIQAEKDALKKLGPQKK